MSQLIFDAEKISHRASYRLETTAKRAARSVFQLTKHPSHYKAIWPVLYLLIYFQTFLSEISVGS